jgi:hypothetical protein
MEWKKGPTITVTVRSRLHETVIVSRAYWRLLILIERWYAQHRLPIFPGPIA